MAEPPRSTIDPAEIARFAALADSWWDPQGPSRPLHRLNPVRLGFLRDRLLRHFGRDAAAMRPFQGLRLLDVGCGGGLVAEPACRMGFAATGIDAAADNVAAARAHAADEGLAIDYRHAAAEELAAAGERFDVVLALEVIEHVAAPEEFVTALGRLVLPGGALILSTLNRTPKSFALGILAAEYLLRWVPRGTHRWSRFVRPAELATGLRRAGLDLVELAGMAYEPIAGRWVLGRDLAVNYLALAVRPRG